MPVLADESSDFTIIGGTLIKYKGMDSDVTIPNGVTEISDQAFYGSSLTSIKIPEGVTTIGEAAFYQCGNLTNVTIPHSVTTIRGNAFRFCNSLTSITIPNNVLSIEESTFSDCAGLTNVTISNGVTSIGTCAFSACANLTSITIPKSVTFIDENAFLESNRLTINGFEDSEAQTYAKNKSIPFSNNNSLSKNEVWTILISIVLGITILAIGTIGTKKFLEERKKQLRSLPLPLQIQQLPLETFCPKCGAHCEADAKFCDECGTLLEPPKPKATEIICPQCNHSCKVTAKFRPECGKTLMDSNEKASEKK